MKQLYKLLSSILLFLIVSLPLFSFGQSDVEIETEIYFFYLELCPSCEEYVLAEELSDTVNTLVKKDKTIGGEAFNIIHDDDAKKMKEILTMRNLAQISHVLPLLVINETYFVGYEEISDKITELKNNQ